MARPDGAPIRPIAQSPIRPFADSPIRPFADSPIRPIAHSPNRPIAQSPIRPLAHSPDRLIAPSPDRPSIPAKICGLTRPEDAALAVQLGATWLGVIFAGGPREVTIEQARGIVKVAGQLPVIGVFGSQGRGEILLICRQAGLSGAQLHAGATPSTVAELRAAGLLVFGVARIAEPADLDQLDQLLQLDCPIVVEPRVSGKLGGTGVTLSLELARAARERLPAGRMILAGGLTPENVAGAVAAVRPDAVDVSSGVEQIPGIKDQQKMQHFLGALR